MPPTTLVSDWRYQSRCRDVDPEVFFPVGSTGPAIEQIKAAKRLCDDCGVRARCLAWALETNQAHGVCGGLSEDERRALRARKLPAMDTAGRQQRSAS